MNKITIGGKDFFFKINNRTNFLYNDLKGSNDFDKSDVDLTLLLFSAIKSANKTSQMSLEDFIEITDNDPKYYQKLNDFYYENYEKPGILEKKRIMEKMVKDGIVEDSGLENILNQKMMEMVSSFQDQIKEVVANQKKQT